MGVPIRWCFALSQGSNPFYDDLIRVAVHSAGRFETLRPVCVYDGDECEITRWLQARNVEVVFWRGTLFEELDALARARNRELVGWGPHSAGVFQRLELPDVARHLGWSDEFVFYTDCDVMWLQDPAPFLQKLRPALFCVAPEFDRTSWLHMNSRAMWMSLRGFGANLPTLRAFARRHIERLPSASWDQGAMRAFFNPLHRALWNIGIADKWNYGLLSRLPFRSFTWDELPLELNWKPYWNFNSDAALVHFHGPKPQMTERARRGELGEVLQPLVTPDYFRYSQIWDEFLVAARS